jgi:hypothetical protein
MKNRPEKLKGNPPTAGDIIGIDKSYIKICK